VTEPFKTVQLSGLFMYMLACESLSCVIEDTESRAFKKVLRGSVCNLHVTLLSGGVFTSCSTKKGFRLSLTVFVFYLAATGA